MELEEEIMHEWRVQNDAYHMNLHQVPSCSQDSGVFSDDESRETVCLSPEPEDLLSSLDEPFSMSPEVTMDRGNRMSSDETNDNFELAAILCDAPETSGDSSTVNSLLDIQTAREPFQNIGLRRSSSIENTMLQLDLREQALVGSANTIGNCCTDKENFTDHKNVETVCRDVDKHAYSMKTTKLVEHSDNSAGLSSRHCTVKPVFHSKGDIKTCNKVAHGRSNRVNAVETEGIPSSSVTSDNFQVQGLDENNICMTRNHSPVDLSETEPPRLVRLKCLSPGEKFRQILLPARTTVVPFSESGFHKAKRTLNVGLSVDQKMRTSEKKVVRGFKRSVSPEPIETTSQQKRFKKNINVEATSIDNARLVPTTEDVFKVPQSIPLRKRSQTLNGTKKLFPTGARNFRSFN